MKMLEVDGVRNVYDIRVQIHPTISHEKIDQMFLLL